MTAHEHDLLTILVFAAERPLPRCWGNLLRIDKVRTSSASDGNLRRHKTSDIAIFSPLFHRQHLTLKTYSNETSNNCPNGHLRPPTIL